MNKFLRKALLVVGGVILSSTAWAQSPKPVYILDFEGATTVADFGGVQHGSGSLMTSEDNSVGTYYQNMSNATDYFEAPVFTSFLEVVPTTNPWAAIKATNSNAFTISFWCNAGFANKKHVHRKNDYGSLFVGYTAKGTSASRQWYYPLGPDLRYQGQFHYNNYGYADNNHDDYMATVGKWDDDNFWHHFAWVFSGLDNATSFTLTLYVDGKQMYSVVETINAANTTGFDMLNDLDRFVIGGASAIWEDPDNAFAYDDIAFYASALTEDQVNTIIAAKNPKTIIGEEDNTSAYLGDYSNYFTLEPNKSITLDFVNYSKKELNYQNWLAVVSTDADRGSAGYSEYVILRADNYGMMTGKNTVDNQDWYRSLTSNYNWGVFKSAMDGSHVVLTVSRGGDVLNIHADITGSNNVQYFEDFVMNCGNASENVRVCLSVEAAHLLLDESKTTITDTEVTGTVSASGYNTFSSIFPLDLSTISDAKAYAATSINANNAVELEEATGKVPAEYGLMVQGVANAEFTVKPTSGATAEIKNNMLVGMPFGGQVTKATEGFNYVFGYTDSRQPGFYQVDEVLPTLQAGRAYLYTTQNLLTTSTDGAPALTISLGDDETTGIRSIDNGKLTIDNVYYDLSGRRVAQPTKGVYVVNGKKVVIK